MRSSVGERSARVARRSLKCALDRIDAAAEQVERQHALLAHELSALPGGEILLQRLALLVGQSQLQGRVSGEAMNVLARLCGLTLP